MKFTVLANFLEKLFPKKHISGPVSLWLYTICFFIFLWIFNPDNKIIALSFVVLFILIVQRTKDIYISLFLTFISSSILLIGKQYILTIIPPGIFPIDRFPNGYTITETITPSHVIVFFMGMLIIARIHTVRSIQKLIQSLDLLDYVFFFYCLWIIISDYFFSINTAISVVPTLLLFIPLLIVWFYTKFLHNKIIFYHYFIALLGALVVVESIFTFHQFVASSPVGKNLEFSKSIEFFGEAIDEIDFFYRPTGTFSHANELAFFLIIIIPILLSSLHSKTLRATSLISLCLAFITLAFTLGRSAWISIFISLTVYCLLEKRFIQNVLFRIIKQYRFYVIAISFVLLVFIVTPRVGKTIISLGGSGWGGDVRIQQIIIALQIIQRYPFFGVGTAMSVVEGLSIDTSGLLRNFPSPVHNSYFLRAAENGMPALMSYLFLLYLIVRKIIFESRKKYVYLKSYHMFLSGIICSILCIIINNFFQPFYADYYIIIITTILINNLFLYGKQTAKTEK